MAKLINIRLNDEDEAKVSRLREAGVEVSELVRSAIRAEFDRVTRAARPRGSAVDVIRALDAEFRAPADAEPRVATKDRHKFRQAAAEHFGRVNRRRA